MTTTEEILHRAIDACDDRGARIKLVRVLSYLRNPLSFAKATAAHNQWVRDIEAEKPAAVAELRRLHREVSEISRD